MGKYLVTVERIFKKNNKKKKIEKNACIFFLSKVKRKGCKKIRRKTKRTKVVFLFLKLLELFLIVL